jgi:hypothetical protein
MSCVHPSSQATLSAVPSTLAVPFSQTISIRSGNPGKAAVVASITPSAPFLKRTAAATKSSVSIR